MLLTIAACCYYYDYKQTSAEKKGGEKVESKTDIGRCLEGDSTPQTGVEANDSGSIVANAAHATSTEAPKRN
ncbi:hypothetical protein [Wolbachia endosymbiont of Ctenocephalides felis wCfeT]|uniref:hypothetical protein n=1 Tax=Wolbachia endosymbiont of Ctenocephalides felis wCfeT TaxID=2732593 RepID=UPI0014489480|nr:hypothetical protein [Wolbachia endosymbiont of Ctenocephalides felis wCfeT]